MNSLERADPAACTSISRDITESVKMERSILNEKIVLSVVIPTKNRSEFVKQPVRAFGGYSAEVEVIVVDDGSAQPCADAVKALCAEQTNCRYVSVPEPHGASSARNLGFSLSRGAYVWFFDDDDEVRPETIAAVMQHVKSKPHANEITLVPMSVWCGALKLGTEDLRTAKPSYQRHRTRGNVVNTSCAIFSRAVLTKAGGWDESLLGGDDSDMFLRCSLFCEFSCLDTLPVRVNIGHRQRFSTQLLKQQKAKLQFLRKHWNHISIRLRLYYVVSFLLMETLFSGPFFYRIRYAIRKKLSPR